MHWNGISPKGGPFQCDYLNLNIFASKDGTFDNLLGLAWDSKARKAVVERWQGFGLKMEILIWFSLKCIYNAV